MRETLKAGTAGALVAGPNGDAKFSTERLRRWRKLGIIPPAGRKGDYNTAAWTFDEAAPAIAAVLFFLFDHAGIQEPRQLASMWRYLAECIDSILADVAGGGRPALVLTQWADPDILEPRMTCCLRLTGDESPITAPSADHDPMAELVVDLRQIVERFAGVNVIPLGRVN